MPRARGSQEGSLPRRAEFLQLLGHQRFDQGNSLLVGVSQLPCAATTSKAIEAGRRSQQDQRRLLGRDPTGVVGTDV